MDYTKNISQFSEARKENVPQKSGYGVRHIQAAIFFLCLSNTYIAKGHIGVTVVAMTSKSKEITSNHNKTVINESNTLIVNTSTDKINFNGNERQNEFNDKLFIHKTDDNNVNYFNWTKSTQEMVLGSFYLGNCIMMFPSGMVCQRWGGKIVLQVALFVNGVVSIITPWLTVWGGWKAICVCRILQGFTQAGTYPSLHTLLAKWVPISERAKITSFVYTGIPIGNGLAFQLGGLLSDSQWGWPSTFWAIGTINLIMFSLLTIFGYATPMEHSRISKEEKEYILESIDTGNAQKPRVPWKAIMTSRPMWGAMAAHIGNGFSFVFIFTQVPSYLHYILGITVKDSGLLTSLQYISAIFFSVSFGWFSDWITNKKIISIRNARRISNSLSLCGVALSLLFVSFTKNMTYAVVCFMIATSSDAFANSGYMVNYIDLAPNFSGLLMAIGSTMMNIVVVFLPIIVSLIVIDVTNLIQWRIMFFIVAGLSLGANLVFVLLMSSETQPWNNFNMNSTELCPQNQKLEGTKQKKLYSYESEDKENIKKTYGLGVRHAQVILIFLCLTTNCMDRGHVGVTIVAMTANQKVIRSNSSTIIDTIEGQNTYNATNDYLLQLHKYSEMSELNDIHNVTSTFAEEQIIQTFDWTKSTQETILGFFYLGNCVTMLPVGLVSHRWGGKVPLQVILVINGIVSIAIPWLSYWGDWKATCFGRFVQGLNQVILYPSTHTLIAKWVPSNELAKLSSFVYTGIPLGNILGPQLSGFLAESQWGWPATFWTVGLIHIVCFVLLTAFGSETPLKHSFITEEEKIYILKNTKAENFRNCMAKQRLPGQLVCSISAFWYLELKHISLAWDQWTLCEMSKSKIPWKAILTSKPSWGAIAAHVGNCFCFVFFFTEVPSYIHYIYGKDIKSSGLLSSLPYVGSMFTSIMFGLLSDYITNNNIVSRKNARRIFNSISHCGLSFALLGVSFTDNITVAVICLVITMCVEVATHPGWMLNYIDLAPNFSGTLMVIGGAFMNLFLLILPVVVSFVITDMTNIIQWRIMLCIIAAVSFISNLIFVLLISAETQSWNYVDNNEGIEENVPENIREKTKL